MLLQALGMGLINAVVPLEQLEKETAVWCREILRNSPTALRVLKAALNAAVRRSPLSLDSMTANQHCLHVKHCFCPCQLGCPSLPRRAGRHMIISTFL